MFSEFDRRLDKRPYVDRKDVFVGPTTLYPPDRIEPYRKIVTNDMGLLEYEMLPGCKAPEDEEEE